MGIRSRSRLISGLRRNVRFRRMSFSMDRSNCARDTILISLALGFLALGLYQPVLHYPFINYDDPEYVSQNPVVQKGLSVAGLRWAFQGAHSGNWHPLT